MELKKWEIDKKKEKIRNITSDVVRKEKKKEKENTVKKGMKRKVCIYL